VRSAQANHPPIPITAINDNQTILRIPSPV
jgi:hypothetical protein